jgi:hypothetical protein
VLHIAQAGSFVCHGKKLALLRSLRASLPFAASIPINEITSAMLRADTHDAHKMHSIKLQVRSSKLQDVANTLWALATMGTKPGQLRIWQLERRAEALTGENSQNITNTL